MLRSALVAAGQLCVKTYYHNFCFAFCSDRIHREAGQLKGEPIVSFRCGSQFASQNEQRNEHFAVNNIVRVSHAHRSGRLHAREPKCPGNQALEYENLLQASSCRRSSRDLFVHDRCIRAPPPHSEINCEAGMHPSASCGPFS